MIVFSIGNLDLADQIRLFIAPWTLLVYRIQVILLNSLYVRV